jgi:arylsulfatase A-like enzyme
MSKRPIARDGQRWPRLVQAAAFTVAMLAALASGRVEAADRPNVVVLLSDDQGWGDLSVHGNTNLQTPHIDSLARDGALFDRFFVCPVCSPTRAEFLTGRYHVRGNISSTSAGGERLDLDERTIADVFKAAGYATAVLGKWHSGGQYPYHPRGRGFDEFYGFCSGHWGDYFSPPLEHNGQHVTGHGFITDDLTDHALEFIEEHRDQPFFCYVPFNTPHAPFQAPDKSYAKFRNAELSLRAAPKRKEEGRGPWKAEDVVTTRAVLAMCENIDANVGRILGRLDDLKLADKTIVLYFCDNGPNTPRWNGGMRGRKGSTDEGGVRSPLLMRFPPQIPAGTQVKEIAGAIDLLPTLAELCGVTIAKGKPLDGMSVAPWLRGQAREPAERMIFSHWAGKVSVRTQQYRLDSLGRLYELATDPGQQRDLAAERPEEASRLRGAVAEWRSGVLSELSHDPQPFTVGYRQWPITFLPAADGIPHGSVVRSDKAPNCSYFTHWAKPQDTITWDVEIATAGRYEAVVYYTCAAKDLGAVIELSVGDSRVAADVSVANDPPLHGLDHDRAPRGPESLLKEFKPLRLGEISLAAGRGTLTLRALKIPHAEAMDTNGVELRLLD